MILIIRKQQGGQILMPGTACLFRVLSAILLICIATFSSCLQMQGVTAQSGSQIFLPAISTGRPPVDTVMIHVPYFDVQDVNHQRYNEMAVFWFGKVSLVDNYTHVRMGYNSQRLTIEVNTYDRELWYDESPSASDVSNWDAVSIYLQVPATVQYGSRLLRFDSQLSHWQDRMAYQAVFESTAIGWKQLNIPFLSEVFWRGDAPNNLVDDKGWAANFEIPFSSLGFSGKPADQSEWRMGIRVHDKDDGPNGSIRSQVWPNGFVENSLQSFGNISFGYPARQTASVKPIGSTVIKEGGGIEVADGSVGGHSTCGANTNYWTEWPNLVYNQGKPMEETVIQNQKDMADFPCFSRYYITFPLGSIPHGKVILSATLTLHQFGNSNPPEAAESFIHVFRIKESWREDMLSWNNSPPVYENYPGIWVDALPYYAGVPGVPHTWDVTQALAAVLQSDSPQELRLVLQSADSAMHSGKYFWSSETASWNNITPPMLRIVWGTP